MPLQSKSIASTLTCTFTLVPLAKQVDGVRGRVTFSLSSFAISCWIKEAVAPGLTKAL